jgi:hypothetical protein
LRYISRSSHDTFRECPRKGFWRYLSGPFNPDGTPGLEEPYTHPALSLGVGWHLGAEKLLQGATGMEAFQASAPVFSSLGDLEQNWLLAAFLAWERAERERFFEKWEVLTVEEEFELPISPNVVLYTRADAVLRDRADGSAWVLNWKTAADVKDWNRKWFFDPQAWTEALAAESKLGVPVSGCIFYGVWKGPMWNGKISSRLVHGYRYANKKDGSLTWATENNGGGERFEVWRERFPFGDGVAAWVSWLDPTFLRKHFVESAPQLRQDALVEGWLRQVVKYESDVDYVLTLPKEDQEAFFWQNWDDRTCRSCSFKDLCLLRATPEAMLEEKFLLPRKRSPRDEAAGRAGGED